MKRNYRYKSMRGLESAIYLEQARIILERFGKEAETNANYGWGASGSDDGQSVSVCTKVYGHGTLQINASIGDCINDFEPEFEFEEFEE